MRLFTISMIAGLVALISGCHCPAPTIRSTEDSRPPHSQSELLVDGARVSASDAPAVWLLFLDEQGRPVSTSTGTVRHSNELLISLHQLPSFAKTEGAEGDILVNGAPCRYRVRNIISSDMPSAGGCAQLQLSGLELECKTLLTEDFTSPIPELTRLFVIGVPQGRAGSRVTGELATKAGIVPVIVINRQLLDADGALHEFIITEQLAGGIGAEIGGASGGPVVALYTLPDGVTRVLKCIGILGGVTEGLNEKGEVVGFYPLIYRPDPEKLRPI